MCRNRFNPHLVFSLFSCISLPPLQLLFFPGVNGRRFGQAVLFWGGKRGFGALSGNGPISVVAAGVRIGN